MSNFTIITKYIGPTNFRGGRISARTGDNRPSTGKPDRLTISYHYSSRTEALHAEAAKALAERLGLSRRLWVAGSIDGGFCFTSLHLSDDGMMPRLPGADISFLS